jgi:type III pantothenate kinase
MILVIDIGNTRFKWGMISGETFVYGGAFCHEGQDLPNLLAAAGLLLPGIQHIFVANVAGAEIEACLTDWVKDNSHAKLSFVGSEAQAMGLTNAYVQPSLLGVDRWLAMLSAWRQHKKAICVIDCGTFVTVDAVNDQGYHLGGLIVPGLALMQSGLKHYKKDEIIDKVPINQYPILLATDTYHAVKGGSVYALVAFIESLSIDLETALGPNVRWLLTGGDAQTLLPLLKPRYQWEPHLVLQGLALMAQRQEIGAVHTELLTIQTT